MAAAEIEEKIRTMIQGYEHLEALTSQMPIDILNMASKHSQQLIGNKTLLTKQDHEELKRQSNQLDDMRSNLESMAYERVVLDVITRDTISSVKRKGSNMKSTNPAVANKRGFSAPRTTPQNSSKNLSSNNLPVASTGATPSLDDFIPIPSYRGAQSQSQETSNRETQPQQSLSTKRNIPSSQHASVTIGSKSAKMVQGSLPPEIAFLANAPLTDEKIRPLKTGNTKPKKSQIVAKRNTERILKMKKELDDFEKRSKSQITSQGEQISDLLNQMKLQERGLQNSVTQVISKMKSSTPSAGVPKKIIIEEEIVDDNEKPKILYPSNSRPKSQSNISTPTLPSPSDSHNQPPIPPLPVEDSSIPLVNTNQQQSDHDYDYNLIIDETGTRWMPIPENVPRIEQEALKPKGNSREGYLAETQDSVLRVIQGNEDKSPHLFFENKLAHPLRSRSEGKTGIPSTSPGSIQKDVPPPSTQPAPPLFEQKYREVPLRRGDVPSNSTQEGNWGGDRYISPYISRVKIHSKYDEATPESSATEENATVPQNESSEKINLPSQVSPPAVDTQQQLIQLLSLLVTTQQQTLQGHNELMMRLLNSSSNTEDSESAQLPPVAAAGATHARAAPPMRAGKYRQVDLEEDQPTDNPEMEQGIEVQDTKLPLVEEGDEETPDSYSEVTASVEEPSVTLEEKVELAPLPQFQRTYQTSFGCLLREGWNFGLAKKNRGEDDAKELDVSEKSEPKDEKEEFCVSKVLWEARTGKHDHEESPQVERIHRIPELHTVETVNRLQHQESAKEASQAALKPLDLNNADPISTVAQVMINALYHMVDSSRVPTGGPKERLGYANSSSLLPNRVVKADPTYPLVNPARYWTDGQDTIAPFNSSGIYGPVNYQPSRGCHRPRERWQNEYGARDVYPYYEGEVPRTTKSKRPETQKHSRKEQKFHANTSNDDSENNMNSQYVTEKSIFEDMKESKINQKNLRHEHVEYEEEEEEEDGDDMIRQKEDKFYLKTNLSSDGSLEEFSFQPKQHQNRDKASKKIRNLDDKEKDDEDPISLFPLPRPLVSHQLANSATKETMDWDMESFLQDDDLKPRRKSRPVTRKPHQEDELLHIKPLRSQKTGGNRKILRMEPYHGVDSDQASTAEKEHWYSPPASPLSSSDQSLTSASYVSLREDRLPQCRNLQFLHPTLSDYEPSTPTLSIASSSSKELPRSRRNIPALKILSSSSSAPPSSAESSPAESHQTPPSKYSTSSSSDTTIISSASSSSSISEANSPVNRENDSNEESDPDRSISKSCCTISDDDSTLEGDGNIAQKILKSISNKSVQPHNQYNQAIIDRSKVRLWRPTSDTLSNPQKGIKKKNVT